MYLAFLTWITFRKFNCLPQSLLKIFFTQTCILAVQCNFGVTVFIRLPETQIWSHNIIMVQPCEQLNFFVLLNILFATLFLKWTTALSSSWRAFVDSKLSVSCQVMQVYFSAHMAIEWLPFVVSSRLLISCLPM